LKLGKKSIHALSAQTQGLSGNQFKSQSELHSGPPLIYTSNSLTTLLWREIVKKLALIVTCALFIPSAFAASPKVLFGFWSFTNNLSIGGPDYGHIYAGENDFTVADWKTIAFLACAREMYPEYPVYLLGDNDATNVVTAAYICTGEINLSNCSQKVYKCNGPSRY
jgi:hypothetical protein